MNFVFRVDASDQIGLGHLSRCVNLAEELRARGNAVLFVCRDHTGNNVRLLEDRHFRTKLLPAPESSNGNISNTYSNWFGVSQSRDAMETIEALDGAIPAWIVVDSYGLDIEWETIVRPHVKKIAVIEDLPERNHDCDLLLDQNYTDRLVSSYQTQIPKHCKLLLGPRHALLDASFMKFRDTDKVWPNKPRKIFVFCGGSDPANLTWLTLEALKGLEFSLLEVDVVIGENNKHHWITEMELVDSKVRLHPSGEKFSVLMSQADLAIGAGGTTMWERMCLGIPSLVVSIAKNQEYACKKLAKDNLIDYLGPVDQVTVNSLRLAIRNSLRTFAKLKAQAKMGQVIVDGKGTQRVAEYLSPTEKDDLKIRLVTRADSTDFFNWVNDPFVRTQSIDQRPINWADHQDWFNEKIATDDSEIYILLATGLPIGQVRLDKKEDQVYIDYSLDSIVRNRGWATLMVTKVIDTYRHRSAQPLRAIVKSDNDASRAVFEKIGFIKQQMGSDPQGGLVDYLLQ